MYINNAFLDGIANSFLFFSNSHFIIPFLILSFIWFERSIFYHAIILVLLSILVNVALKVSFQIPLAPFLNKKGFAFPSGHMQLATVLYCWLAYELKQKWFSLLIIGMLSGIGCSLIYYGYHNFYDVIAGVFFALLLLSGYLVLIKKADSFSSLILIGLATAAIFYIMLRYSPIEAYVWTAYYALLGFLTSTSLLKNKIRKMGVANKLLATLLSIFTVFLLQQFFYYAFYPPTPAYIYQLQWLLIGLLIPIIKCAASIGIKGKLK